MRPDRLESRFQSHARGIPLVFTAARKSLSSISWKLDFGVSAGGKMWFARIRFGTTRAYRNVVALDPVILRERVPSKEYNGRTLLSCVAISIAPAQIEFALRARFILSVSPILAPKMIFQHPQAKLRSAWINAFSWKAQLHHWSADPSVAFLNPHAQTDRAICGVHFMAIAVQRSESLQLTPSRPKVLYPSEQKKFGL
jgi:hypothetical protein